MPWIYTASKVSPKEIPSWCSTFSSALKRAPASRYYAMGLAQATATSNFMNSIEPFTPGSPNASHHYVWDRNDSGQFPLAQYAYDRGLMKLYGNAWSAPGYMKTNGDENNGGLLCGVTNASCESGNWMQPYSNYLVQWAHFYKQSGVKVTNLGFLNEPKFAASYAGMLSDGAQAAEFIRVLAATISPSTVVMVLAGKSKRR